jgi:prefoldin subunit 5
MANYDDLNRALGMVEGELKGVSSRMDNIETLLQRIDDRLSAIEKLESERKGAQKFVVWASGLIGGIVATAATFFFK